jgi:mono/diheme cytochrome c family protein
MRKLTAVSSACVLLLTSSFISLPQDDTKASIDRGAKVYQTYCLSCHQANGMGVPKMTPPLKKTKWVLGDKKELTQMLLKGLQGEIEIDGQYFNGVMPSQSYLKDQELADVMTYVRNSFGNKAAPISAAEVKKWRATLKP